MSNYRRNREGHTYFFTVVMDQRQHILTANLGRQSLRTAIKSLHSTNPFQIVAIVLLPDHLHTIWELPRGDTDYSTRWKKIKSKFTKLWRKQGGPTTERSMSRVKRGEHGVWQRRFF